MTIKVSVSITTYNHEKFIAEAIESVLMQETNFDYEIIIGEDDSSDKTREIVKTYKQKYPEKIRLFLNDRKNVIYIDGKPTGRWNFVNNLRHARGQYIALLDGDDYWTSPHKLQKQVDFLDRHSECSICFHNVEVFNEDTKEGTPFHGEGLKPFHTIKDLALGNFIPACSTMFRAGLFGEFPQWFYTMPVADWPLHLLNAQHGEIGYIDEILGVYRRHRGSIWSTKGPIDRHRIPIRSTEIVKHQFGWRLRLKFNDQIGFHHYSIAGLLYEENNFQIAGVHATKCLMSPPLRKGIHKRFLLRMILRGRFPKAYDFLRRARRALWWSA